MADNSKRVTKKDYFNAIRAIVDVVESDGMTLDFEDITYDTLRDFISKELELIDNKAAAAKKRADEKKIAGDELRERILNVLSYDEWMTISDVAAALNDPDVSEQMITPRLTQLCSPDIYLVEKDSKNVTPVNGSKSKKRTVYRKRA